MRRLIPLLLVLLLCGCGARVPTTASASLPTELEEGVWPEIALTENVPQPEAAQVGQVLLLPDGDSLLITVENLDYGYLTVWLDRLTLSGFTTIAFTQEGQTACGLLTDGSAALSFTHLGDVGTLTVSLSPDKS